MPKRFNPFVSVSDAIRLGARIGALTVTAQTVIVLRLWAMVGFIPMPSGERSRMVREKVRAAAEGGRAVAAAAMTGARPALAAEAAITPAARRVRSNVRRLSAHAAARGKRRS